MRFALTLKKDEPALLTATSGEHSVTVSGDVPEVPLKSPLSKELSEKSLKKLGGTPYYFKSLEFNNNEALTLPLSSINYLRREAVASLTKSITDFSREITNTLPEKEKPYISKEHHMRARFSSFSQYSEDFKKCEYISLPIDEILRFPECVKIIEPTLIAELPALLYPKDEEGLKEKLLKIKKLGVTDVAVGNAGTLKLSRDLGFTLHGGHRLNITNTKSLSQYEALGLKSAALSFEMNYRDINSLGASIPRGHISYGFLPLMLFRACPQKGKNGCKGCNGVSALTDRKGVDFTVLCHNGKYSTLLNSVPLYICDKESLNTDFELLYFTTENKEECKKVLSSAIKKAPLKGAKTAGMYFRELL